MRKVQFTETVLRDANQSLIATRLPFKEFEGIVNDTNVRNSLEKSYAERSISLIDYLAEYRFFLEAEARLDEMKYQYSQKFIELSKYDSFLAE